MKIAVTHPGKLGDAIYSLPTIRWLCEKHECKADFWTSSYCSPLKRLFEYQECIDEFYISPNYVIQHMGCGVQPWEVPVEKNYDFVYQLGFKYHPDIGLSDFIAKCANAPLGMPIIYEHPEFYMYEEKFICIAPRGDTTYIPLIEEVHSKYTIVQIGGKGDYVGQIGRNLTGFDMLETVSCLAKCIGFIGPLSSQLVLADGFKMPKLVWYPNTPWKESTKETVLKFMNDCTN